MAPLMQKAIVVKHVGQPLQLVTDWPVPIPGPDQVLIKVENAGLNPHDQKARDWGLFIADGLPAVLTNDVAGTVVSLGPGVTKYQIGDKIVSHATFTPDWVQSGLQEYAINDIDAGFKIPEGTSLEAAATLPTCLIPAVAGFFDTERGFGLPAPWSEEGKTFDFGTVTLLIIGGGSSCGKFAVQVAKIAAFGNIVVVGGDEEELKSLGAHQVLDRHGGEEKVLERIRSVVGDDLMYAYDAVSPPDGQILALNALSSTKKGKLVRLLPLGPVDDSKVVAKKAGYEVKDVRGFSQLYPSLTYPFWDLVPGYLTSGKIKPVGYELKEGLKPDIVNTVLDAYKSGQRVLKTHIKI